MNTDIRLQVTFFNHPKTVKLRKRLGDGAVLSLITLWGFVAQNRPDGVLLGMDDEDIEIAAQWPGENGVFAKMLVTLRLMDRIEGGACQIHDWAENNPWAAGFSARSSASKKAAGSKWGQDTKENANKKKRSERLTEAREKGRHTSEQWERLKHYFGGKCVRCGAGDDIVKDHILPIYQGGSDGLENLQPLCRKCNSSKGPESIDFRLKIDPGLRCLSEMNACQMPAKVCGDTVETPPPFLSFPLPIPEPTTATTSAREKIERSVAENREKIEQLFPDRDIDVAVEKLVATGTDPIDPYRTVLQWLQREFPKQKQPRSRDAPIDRRQSETERILAANAAASRAIIGAQL